MDKRVELVSRRKNNVLSKNTFVCCTLALLFATTTATFATRSENPISDKKNVRILTPLNIAILIQDDLISQVGNELDITRDFIRSLPAGSRVMIGYITSGTLQVRQPFTTDLNKAAGSLRIPLASQRHRHSILMWKSSKLSASLMLVGRELMPCS